MPTTNRKLDKMWELKRAKPTSDTERLMQAMPGEDLTETEHPLSSVIEDALQEFTEAERELIVMSVVGGLAVREIADATGISKSEVHRRLAALMPRLTAVFKSNPQIKEYVRGIGH